MNCKIVEAKGLAGIEKNSKLQLKLLKLFPSETDKNSEGGSLYYDYLTNKEFIKFYGQWFKTEDEASNEKWRKFYDKFKKNKILFDELGEPKLYEKNNNFFFINHKGERLYLKKNQLGIKQKIEIVNAITTFLLEGDKIKSIDFVEKLLNERAEDLHSKIEEIDIKLENQDKLTEEEIIYLEDSSLDLVNKLAIIEDDILNNKPVLNVIKKSVESNLNFFSTKYIEEVDEKEDHLESNDDITNMTKTSNEVRDTNNIDESIVRLISSIKDKEIQLDGTEIQKYSTLLNLPLGKNPTVIKNKLVSILSNIIEQGLSDNEQVIDPYGLMISKLTEFYNETNDYTIKEFLTNIDKTYKKLNKLDKAAFETKFVTSFYLAQNIFSITEVSKKGDKLILRHVDPASSQDKEALISNNLIRSFISKYKYSFSLDEISNEKSYEKAMMLLINVKNQSDLKTGLDLLNLNVSDKTISDLFKNRNNLLKSKTKIIKLSDLFLKDDNSTINPFFNFEINFYNTEKSTEDKVRVTGMKKILKSFDSANVETQKNIIKGLSDKSVYTPISIISMYEAKNKEDLADSSMFVGNKQRWMYSLMSHINKEILKWKSGNIDSLLNKSHKNLIYVDYLLAKDGIDAGDYTENSKEHLDEMNSRIENLNLIINSEIKTIADNNPVEHKEIGEADLHMDIMFKMFNNKDEIYRDVLEKQTNLDKLSAAKSAKKDKIYSNSFSADKSSAYGVKGLADLPSDVILNKQDKIKTLGKNTRNVLLGYLKGEYTNILNHSDLLQKYDSISNKKEKQLFLMNNLIPDYHYVTKLPDGRKFNPEDSSDVLTSEFVDAGTWNKFGMLNSVLNDNDRFKRIMFTKQGSFNLATSEQDVELDKMLDVLENQVIKIVEKDKEYFDNFDLILKPGRNVKLFNISTNIEESNSPKEIYNYAVNSLINNLEMFSMFNGDLGFYKQKSEKLNMEDALKRGPEIFTDGLYFKHKSEKDVQEYKDYSGKAITVDKNRVGVTAVVNPIESKNSKYSNLINAASGNTLDYKHEIADGQGFGTIDFFKKMISGIYGWTSNDDKIYKRLNDPSYKYTDEDIKWLKQAGRSSAPVKFVHYSMENIYGSDGKTIIGEYPVYYKYSLAILAPAITKGTELDNVYKALNNQNIDQLLFKSASKASNKTLTTIHNLDENGIFNGLKKNIKLNPQEFSLAGMKLQVELPTKFDKTGAIGTQHVKNLLGNIDKSSLEKNYFYRGDYYTGKEIIELYDSTAIDILDVQLHKLKQKINFKKDELGKFTFNEGKLRDLIIGQLDITTEADLIDLLKDSDLPLEAMPSVAQRMFPIISKYMHKKVGKIETNAGGVIQVANIGFDRVSNKEANNVIYLKDNLELKPPLPLTDSEGNILYFREDGTSSLNPKDGKMRISNAQVMMPFSSIYAKTGMSYEEFKKAFKEGRVDMKIFENIIGYRIPNQSISSNDAIEIVGILPPSMGDTAIVYHEITAKTGSDFDIDKMYLMMPNYDIIDNQIVYNESNNQAGKQNKLIEVMRSILTSPATYDDLMSPLDSTIVKDTILNNLFIKAKEENDTLNKDDFKESRIKSPLEQLSAVNMVKARVDMLNAKGLVATMANHMTDIPMSQIVDQILKYDIGVDSHSFAKEFMQGKELNSEFKLTKLVSYLMNAAVDAAKDNYIIEGNFNSYTANAAMVMIRMGVPIDDVFKVLLNDSILYLSRLKQTQTGKTSDIVLTDYSDDLMNNKAKSFVNWIENGNKINFNEFLITKEDNILTEELILGFWHILQLAGKELNNELVASKPDSNGAGKNIQEHLALFNRLERMKKDSIGTDIEGNFSRGRKLFKNGIENVELKFDENANAETHTFLGVMMNNSLFLTNELTKNMFIENTDGYREIINTVSEQFGDGLPTSADNIKSISKYIYPFITSFSNHEIYKLYEDEVKYLQNEFLNEFIEMKKSKNNLFLNELYIDASTNLISFPGSRFYDANNKMLLKEQFEYLYETNPKFVEKLIKYSFITTGFKPTYFSFNEYLPIDYFLNSGHGAAINNLINKLGPDSIFKEEEYIKDIIKFIAINNEIDYRFVRNVKKLDGVSDGIAVKQRSTVAKLFNKNTNSFHLFARSTIKEELFMLVGTDFIKDKETGTIIEVPIYKEIRSNVEKNNKIKVKLFDLNKVKNNNLFFFEDKTSDLSLKKREEYVSGLDIIFNDRNWTVQNDDVYLSKINQIEEKENNEEDNTLPDCI